LKRAGNWTLRVSKNPELETHGRMEEPEGKWKYFQGPWIPVLVAVLYGGFYAMAFPPVDSFETAFLFVIPFILWAALRPSWFSYGLAAYLGSWGAWVFLLSWLRHVPSAADMPAPLLIGWGLVLLVSSLVALIPAAWLLSVRWVLPRIQYRPLSERIGGMVALACFWVVLEWVRTWFLFGFPWLPLSASQWRNPVLLQIAAYTGAYGISFLLILINLGIAFYIRKIVTARRGTKWFQRFCPEFYVSLGALLLVLILYAQGIPKAGEVAPAFRAGVVQPAVPQRYKWEAGEARENLRVLQRQTRLINALDPDVLLWPESATPNPVIGTHNLRDWIEDLAAELDTPLLMGNLAEESEGLWYNGIFGVEPEKGLVEPYYKKRKLVPFGEYVPFREWIPFLDKFVPIESDFTAGTEPTLVPLTINHKKWNVGGLVCYEDIFPGLARELTRQGAEFFFVATNNGWYGREGAAYQHATHSVLRAVENGRPVLRTGNDGWSGYIDERGHRRNIILNENNTIYFRGGSVMEIYRNRVMSRQFTFYSRHGDWFVWLSILLCTGAFFFFRRIDPGQSPKKEDSDLLPQVGLTTRRIIRDSPRRDSGDA